MEASSSSLRVALFCSSLSLPGRQFEENRLGAPACLLSHPIWDRRNIDCKKSQLCILTAVTVPYKQPARVLKFISLYYESWTLGHHDSNATSVDKLLGSQTFSCGEDNALGQISGLSLIQLLIPIFYMLYLVHGQMFRRIVVVHTLSGHGTY